MTNRTYCETLVLIHPYEKVHVMLDPLTLIEQKIIEFVNF